MSTSNVRSLGRRLLGVAFPAMVLVALLSATMAQAATAKPPDAPGAPTVTATTNALKVSWEAPGDNGSTITGYNVRTLEKGESYLDWIWAPAGSTSATVAGLTSKKTYFVDVQAVGSAGDSSWSPATEATTPADTPPGKPVPPTVTQSQENTADKEVTLTVTWEPPVNKGSKITSYQVRYKRSGSGVFERFRDLDENEVQNRQIEMPEMKVGKYEFQVQARNDVGWGEWSDPGSGTAQVSTAATAKTGNPGTPATPTVVATATRHITVKWSAPDPGASPITKYNLRARIRGESSADADWFNVTDKVPGTSTVVTQWKLEGLTPNKPYLIDVQAVNVVGDKDQKSGETVGAERKGAWSTQVAASTKPQGRPTAPLSVVVAPNPGKAPDSTLTVSWKPPQNDGGFDVESYNVQYRQRGTGTWSAKDTEDSSIVLEGLTHSKTYNIRVHAKTEKGYSNWATVSGTVGRAGQPWTVATPDVTVDSNRQITVSWTAPEVPGDNPIKSYEVRYKAKGSNSYSSTKIFYTYDTDADQARRAAQTKKLGYDPLGNSDPEWRITGLKPNTEYSVQVRARNKHRGEWSADGKKTTHGPPSAPGSLTVAPKTKAAVGKTATLTVTWGKPASMGVPDMSINRYDLRYRQKSGGSYKNVTFDAGSNADNYNDEGGSYDITGLKLDTTYIVGVRAQNAVYGGGPWASKEVSTSAAPAAPAAPTVEAISSSALIVKWKPRVNPANPGQKLADVHEGDEIGFNLRYRPAGGDYKTVAITPDPSPVQSTTLRNLKPGIAYEVQLQAVREWTDGGVSKIEPYTWSNTGTGSTFGPPSAPVDTSAAADSLTQLTVTWGKPAGDGGSDITGFNVEYKPADGEAMTMKAKADATSAMLKGLTADTKYEVSVQAVNKYGTGAAAKVEASTYSTAAPTAPAAPTVKVDSTTALTVTWVKPDMGGSPIKGYDVRYRAADGAYADKPMWLAADATSVSLADLKPDTMYMVSVQAYNKHGSAGSGWSASATATTEGAGPAEAPGKVTPTVMSDEPGTLSITWGAPTEGGAPKGYNIRYGPVGGPYEWMWASGDATSASIAGLTSGATYEVDLQATNKHGDGAWAWGGLGTFTAK